MVIRWDFRHKRHDGDLLITMACPIECDFCVYSCTASKEPWKWMPEETIRRVAEEYSKNDVGIRISGGEPFYDLEKLDRCIDILLEYYKPFEILIITSGFFGSNKANIERYIDVIKKRDFDLLVVSIDRFHQKKIPLKNIENIIEVCNEMDIEIALRLSLDSLSFPLIDKVSKLIVKNKLPMEAYNWGDFGRAEKIGNSSLKDGERALEYFFLKIKKVAEKYCAPPDPRYYWTHTPKKSQRKYAMEFFPTTFPNGNVYACSITTKGSYMGNINKENLLDMILKFKKTFPGYYMFSNSNCSHLMNFLPDKYKFKCEFCKNTFFIKVKKNPEEVLGRELIKITMESDLNKLFKQMLDKKKSITQKEYEREFLLSFRLSENDVKNKKTGLRIKNFLDKMNANKIRFVLSRPLPPCIGEVINDIQPKNCFECRELFTVEKGFIRYCESLGGIKGYRFDFVKDRNQIYEYFKIERNKLKLPKKCDDCLFRIRNQCNGICHRYEI